MEGTVASQENTSIYQELHSEIVRAVCAGTQLLHSQRDFSYSQKNLWKTEPTDLPKTHSPWVGFGYCGGWQEAQELCRKALSGDIPTTHKGKEDFMPEGSPWLHLHFIGTIYNSLEPKNSNFFWLEETAASFLFLYQKKKYYFELTLLDK